MASLPPDNLLPGWGPSDEELAVRAAEVNQEILDLSEDFADLEGEEIDEDLDADVDKDELDAGLVERLDALEFVEDDEMYNYE